MPPESQQPLFTGLSSNALLAITGDDAAKFLQGQLTNDVEALELGQAQWNGWCSPKGRLLATFLLLRRPEGFIAMLPAEIAPAIAKRLAMYVLRSRVKVRDASAEFERYGVMGPGALQAVRHLTGTAPLPLQSLERDSLVSVALTEDLYLVLAPKGDTRAAGILEALGPRGNDAGWEHMLIRAGIPTIVAATQEAFVPQMANFELLGGVSFKKGCYTGQEIVARTQYRGILKRRMAIAHVDAPATPSPGQSVYSPAFGEQSAGTVVNAAPAPEGGYDFLVVAQIESLREGGLRLGSTDGAPVVIHSHPTADPPAQ